MYTDLRYAIRQLLKDPGFTTVAVFILALGIGANTAIFQLLDAVRLRSLPIQKPHELIEVKIVGGNRGMGVNGRYGGLTRPIWQEIREAQQAFSGAFAWSAGDVRVGKGSDLRRANGLWVSGDFFRVLGVRPRQGRLILPEDEVGACPATKAVVSHSYWQSHMGARDLSADNRLMVDGEPKEVVGVTPPEFFGLAVGERFDIVQPYCQPKELRRDVFDVSVMGRLRPGWTLERASAHFDASSPGIFEVTALTGYSAKTIESYKKFRLAAYPASGGVSELRRKYDFSLWLLLATTGLVLLIACVNLANLMLARASVRERELAVRLALGASRGRLFRHLLMESALLASTGAALGMWLAQTLSRVLILALSTERSEVSLSIETDWRVFLFIAIVATFTCVAFGAVPALRATGTDPITAMKSGGRGLTAGRERFSLQRMMVAGQIAVSLVLLVGALLFVRSFRNLLTFDPGMRQQGITLAFIGFHDSQIPRDRYADFQRTLLEEVRSAPGILGAVSTTHVPLIGGAWGHGITTSSSEGFAMFSWVSPGYFQTMRIPLRMGREFNQDDTGASPRVAVVNQTFVNKLLGGANPIGQTLRTSPEPNYPSTVYEIVGVVGDTKYDDFRRETPAIAFGPASQFPALGPWAAMLIHSSLAPEAAIATVKQRLRERHPELVVEFSVFQSQIQERFGQERLMAMVSGFFGFLAALLAVIGLYGLISYIVTRRRHEIGIRAALGAQPRDLRWLVLRESLLLTAIGAAIGLPAVLMTGRLASSLLFGITATDPITIASSTLLLVGAAILSGYLPAHRAAKVDPMVALRVE
jgi:putative ABC transport system permease protein